MNLIKNKKGQFSSIKWVGSSVSSLVVIAGLIIYFTGDKGLGAFFIFIGLVAAFLMSPAGQKLMR